MLSGLARMSGCAFSAVGMDEIGLTLDSGEVTSYHSLGFRWARGRPVLRLGSWHFRLNLLSCVFSIKHGVFKMFAMRFTICLNDCA